MRIDREQIQALIIDGFEHNCARHFFLHIHNTDKTKQFLSDISRHITLWSGNEPCVDTPAVSLGITYNGLVKLGLPQQMCKQLEMIAPAFTEGAYVRAGRQLGDSGTSAPEYWDDRFSKPDRLHLYISIHAETQEQLDQHEAKIRDSAGHSGLTGWENPMPTEHFTERPDRREHFGFRDGISQPSIRGTPNRVDASPIMTTQPGEFILGYQNDCGENLWTTITPSGRLRSDENLFFRNGSFAAVRVMEQDVAGFHEHIAHLHDEIVPKQMESKPSKERIAAMMCGRWQNGEPLLPGLLEEPAEGATPTVLNNFDFRDDPDATHCPIQSHIRRLNDRDPAALPSERRFLLRRGMPYGPTLEQDAEAKRGLFGVFVCSDIQYQFEFIMKMWANMSDGSVARDPLIGNHQSEVAPNPLQINNNGESKEVQLTGFRPFVVTKGTTYVFYPSAIALEHLSRRLVTMMKAPPLSMIRLLT